MIVVNPSSRIRFFQSIKFIHIFIVVIFGLIYSLNSKMPLAGEDYTLQPWEFNRAPSTLSGKIQAIIEKVNYSASEWSPRIGEALTTITAAFPKSVFNLFNTIFITWLGILLFAIVNGRFPSATKIQDAIEIFIIYLCVICLFPLLGQIFFWKAGATNHLWGIIMLLCFALPFRMEYSRHKIKNGGLLAIYICIGFIAGLTIENAAPIFFIILILYFGHNYRHNRIDWKYIFPLISFGIGISILLFSPATTSRRHYYSQLGSDNGLTGLALLINRFIRINTDFLQLSLPLILIMLILIIIYSILWPRFSEVDLVDFKLRPRALLLSVITAYLPVLLLLTIAYQSDQRRGFAIFWVISIGLIAFLTIEILKKLPVVWEVIIVSILVLIFIIQSVQAISVYSSFSKQATLRNELISTALIMGKRTVTLQRINIPDSRIIETRESLPDLNDRISQYYGFEKVIFVH